LGKTEEDNLVRIYLPFLKKQKNLSLQSPQWHSSNFAMSSPFVIYGFFGG